jgi:tetratricopeptide (TPR) repeat protein
MKYAITTILVIFTAAFVLAQSPNDLFQQAMLDMFDGKWDQALQKLEQVGNSDAPEELKTRSHFFAARALEKSGRQEESLRQYEQFLRAGSSDPALRKEAGFARVKIASQLYMAGKRGYASRVVEALEAPDLELRFLAAVQLSYFPDRNLRQRAVPVLQETLSRNPDDDVRNQAALALLRIDPKLLEKKPSESSAPVGNNLHLLLHGSDGGEIRLALPVSLARLALGALPESMRKDLQEEGINPDNILEMLSKTGEILEVKSDGSVIRLWID